MSSSEACKQKHSCTGCARVKHTMDWQVKMNDLATRNRWTVIAISGATNSGKTTLATKIKNIFTESAVVLNQDAYFRSPDDPNHVWVELVPKRMHQNWERLECVDWSAMCDKIEQILSKPATINGEKLENRFLILDGHIILNYRPIASICKLKFFIQLDSMQTMHERRIHRNYIPADPEGYFEQWVWPMYVRNRNDLRDQPNIVYIDGSQSIDAMFDLLYKRLINVHRNQERKKIPL